MKYLKVLFVAVCCVTFFGCANNMALSKGQTQISTAEKSIVLLPVKVANKNRPGYQPTLFAAALDGTEKQTVSIKDGLYKEEDDSYKEFLLSFSLKPGSYTLNQIYGNYMIPLLVKATCVLPLQLSFEVKPNSVTYLGHVNAAIVERKTNEEERAGSLIPLMDQALAGFSNGTFQVLIEDRYDEDIANYRKAYPGLNGVSIEKAVLPLPKVTAVN